MKNARELSHRPVPVRRLSGRSKDDTGGALSAATGTLDLSGSSIGEDLKLVWMERGGPQVEPPDNGDGYGSRLVNRSISGQLGGSIAYDWSDAGVIITLRVNGRGLAT